MSARISQRDARLMRKELAAYREAERAMRGWSGDYWPGGVQVSSVDCAWCPTVTMAIRTARKLQHAVVAVVDHSETIRFIALPLPKVQA